MKNRGDAPAAGGGPNAPPSGRGAEHFQKK